MTWLPTEGREARDFLQQIPECSREAVLRSAVSILSRCVPPAANQGRETGLVIGYVQSGKTMSFETVGALARDNSFRMVVLNLVAGSSNPLLGQSTGRFVSDLRLQSPDRPRAWLHLENPSRDDTTLQTIKDVLDDWKDPTTPDDYKKTILITVLKQHQRLGNLTELIRYIDMRGVSVLIIDDEADQASLNTEVAQGTESTTYRRLIELRDSLPSHTYLQYTATPQAPLLINIIDSLSPNFVQVLEPGDQYVGGREFFLENPNLIRIIPPDEVPTNANALNEPPNTLIEALRMFMVGVVAGITVSGNSGNRSMLVHPSHRTTQHQEFYNWVRDIIDDWKRILTLPQGDPDRAELFEDFHTAYNELSLTVHDGLPAFSDLTDRFSFAFRNTRILEVNARDNRRTPTVDWRSTYGWILVGGQAMDRGFTVEGLTVTYMPRGIGVGNADTVQQRGRFFGYKRSYLGYCRVYLEQGTAQAFRRYVEHEEDIRQQLVRIAVTGEPLNSWKRAFVLDPNLRPCRRQVIEFDYIRGALSDAWFIPRVVLASDEMVEANRRRVDDFLNTIQLSAAPGHPDRTETQKHEIARGVVLRNVLESLLIPFRIAGTTDSQKFTGLLLQLSKALETDENEICTIYRMSGGKCRERGIDIDGEITNLFQGENPVTPRPLRGTIYPGDRAIHEDAHVTVQVHWLNLTRDGKTIKRDVPVIAVWVPSRLAADWVSQHQPAQG